MFSAIYPLFEKGRLLKIEMLECLRDFPREILQIYLKDYKNGILSGCEISVNEYCLVIQPGIILFHGILYVLKDTYEVPYLSNDRLTVLKVNCLDKDIEKDFIHYISQIYLDYNTTCKETEVELCRFKLKKGARLRMEYKDFYDFNTEYDTVNRIYVPYLGKGKTTLVPEIVMAFARAALKYHPLEAIDLQFCFLALQNNGRVERSVLEAYLEAKNEQINDQTSQIILYEGLSNILRRIEKGEQIKNHRKGFGKGILVD